MTTKVHKCTERVPFCEAFRACVFSEPVVIRPVEPPDYTGFEPAYIQICQYQELEPDDFKWDGSSLAYFLFESVLRVAPATVSLF